MTENNRKYSIKLKGNTNKSVNVYNTGKFFEDTTLWIHDFGVMVTYDFDEAKQFKKSYITGYNSKTKPKNEYIYD
jgi:hypothetical protein